MLKDHKPPRSDGSQPGRPLCLAKRAPNMVLGNLVSEVLERIADAEQNEHECINTEMLCREVQDANIRIKQNNVSREDVVIGSLDAVALYPSLKLQETSDIIHNMVLQSEVDVRGLQWKELAKYLYIVCTPQQIDRAGLRDFLPIRYTTRGTPTLRYLLSDIVKLKPSDGRSDMTREGNDDDNNEDGLDDDDNDSDDEDCDDDEDEGIIHDEDDHQCIKCRELLIKPLESEVKPGTNKIHNVLPDWPLSPVKKPRCHKKVTWHHTVQGGDVGPDPPPTGVSSEEKSGLKPGYRYKWIWQYTQVPNKRQLHRMFSLAIVMGFQSVFTSHIYRQNGKYYLQGDKGPIGHIVTGSAARLVLIDFNKRFTSMVKRLKIELFLFARYVDDIDLSVKRLKKGLKFNKDTGELEETGEKTTEDDKMTDDEVMQVLTDIANSVHRMLTWEPDSVTNHEDNKLPVLDVKMFLAKEDDRDGPIKFKFYKKEIANKKLIPAESAMTSQVKFATLVEELGRRLRNTCPSILPEREGDLVRDFNVRMAEGHHKEKFRYRVTRTALDRYRKIRSQEEEGGRRLYRSKEEIIASRRENKGKRSKSGWHKARGFNATLQVQHTPSGTLAKRIRMRINQDPELKSMGVLICENNGDQLRKTVNFVKTGKGRESSWKPHLGKSHASARI